MDIFAAIFLVLAAAGFAIGMAGSPYIGAATLAVGLAAWVISMRNT